MAISFKFAAKVLLFFDIRKKTIKKIARLSDFLDFGAISH